MSNIFKKIIKEICEEKNIKYELLSNDWIFLLKYNDKIRYIMGYKFGLHNYTLGSILDDKYALYELLKYNSIPIIEHNIVYGSDNNNSYAIGYNSLEYVRKYYKNNNNDIVLKPNRGTCGVDVYHIKDDEKLLINVLEKLLNKNFSISMCPYYDIKSEYRIIILNNEIKLIYKKIKPVITGNGINTIRQLLEKINPGYFKEINDNNLDRVLDKDEKFEYNWKFNLSGGATIDYVNDKDIEEELINMALKVSKSIDLVFGSIDIIETNDNKLYVMEVNNGVMLDNYIRLVSDGYEIAKDIYREAIEIMFKND